MSLERLASTSRNLPIPAPQASFYLSNATNDDSSVAEICIVAENTLLMSFEVIANVSNSAYPAGCTYKLTVLPIFPPFAEASYLETSFQYLQLDNDDYINSTLVRLLFSCLPV